MATTQAVLCGVRMNTECALHKQSAAPTCVGRGRTRRRTVKEEAEEAEAADAASKPGKHSQFAMSLSIIFLVCFSLSANSRANRRVGGTVGTTKFNVSERNHQLLLSHGNRQIVCLRHGRRRCSGQEESQAISLVAQPPTILQSPCLRQRAW